MSKCSSCNQTLPELRPVKVLCCAVDYEPSEFAMRPGPRTSTCCEALGSEDALALKDLVNSGFRLVLMPERQLNEGQSSDQKGALADDRNLLEELRKAHTELLTDNDSLSSRLADIRKVAFL